MEKPEQSPPREALLPYLLLLGEKHLLCVTGFIQMELSNKNHAFGSLKICYDFQMSVISARKN